MAHIENGQPPQTNNDNQQTQYISRVPKLIAALRSVLLPLTKNFSKSALDLANKARLMFYLGTILLHGCSDAEYPYLFLTSDSRIPSHGVLKDLSFDEEHARSPRSTQSQLSTYIGSWYTLAEGKSQTSVDSEKITPAHLEQLLSFQKSLFFTPSVPLPNNRFEESILLFTIALELYQPRISRFRTIVTHLDSAIRTTIWRDSLPPAVERLFLEEGNAVYQPKSPSESPTTEPNPNEVEMTEPVSDVSSDQNQNTRSPPSSDSPSSPGPDVDPLDTIDEGEGGVNSDQPSPEELRKQNLLKEYEIEKPKLLSLFDHIALAMVNQTSASPDTLIETYQRAINTLKILPSTEPLGDTEFSYFGGTHMHLQLALALLNAESYDLAFLLLSQIKNSLIPLYFDNEHNNDIQVKKLYHLMILRVFYLLIVTCIHIYFFSKKTSILIPETGKNEQLRRELLQQFQDLPLPPPQTPKIVWEAILYLVRCRETVFPYSDSPAVSVTSLGSNLGNLDFNIPTNPASSNDSSTPIPTQSDHSLLFSQDYEIKRTFSSLLLSIGVLCSHLSHHGRNTKQHSLSNIYPNTNTPFFSSKDKIQLLEHSQWWFLASLRTFVYPQAFVFLADLEVSPRNDTKNPTKALRYITLASRLGYGQNPHSNHPIQPGGPKLWTSLSKALLTPRTVSHTQHALDAITASLSLFPFNYSLWLEKAVILFTLKQLRLETIPNSDTILKRAISNDISLHSEILDSILTAFKCLELLESEKDHGFTLSDWFGSGQSTKGWVSVFGSSNASSDQSPSSGTNTGPGSNSMNTSTSGTGSKSSSQNKITGTLGSTKSDIGKSTSPGEQFENRNTLGETLMLHTVDSLVNNFEVIARIIFSLRSSPIRSLESTQNLETLLEFILDIEFMETNRYQD